MLRRISLAGVLLLLAAATPARVSPRGTLNFIADDSDVVAVDIMVDGIEEHMLPAAMGENHIPLAQVGTLAVAEGAHSLKVRLVDGADNASDFVVLDYVIDTTKPAPPGGCAITR